MSRIPTAWEMADRRAASSESQDRFWLAFDLTLAADEAGRDVASQPPPTDPVVLAAEIEALAAARRRASIRHPQGHACDACRIRRIDHATDTRGNR